MDVGLPLPERVKTTKRTGNQELGVLIFKDSVTAASRTTPAILPTNGERSNSARHLTSTKH